MHMQTHMHTQTQLHTQRQLHTDTCAHRHMRTRRHMCTQTHMHTHAHIELRCAHVDTRMHTQTNAHTRSTRWEGRGFWSEDHLGATPVRLLAGCATTSKRRAPASLSLPICELGIAPAVQEHSAGQTHSYCGTSAREASLNPWLLPPPRSPRTKHETTPRHPWGERFPLHLAPVHVGARRSPVWPALLSLSGTSVHLAHLPAGGDPVPQGPSPTCPPPCTC